MSKNPKNLIIYLVRHGRKDLKRFRKNSGEPCFLSKIGLQQAGYLARKFEGECIDKLISSDYERCVQTAEPISKALGIPINKDKGLRELSKEFRNLFWSGEGYEDREVKEDISRIKKSWDRIFNGSGKIVVVAHGGTNRVIMSLVLGIEPHMAKFGINPAGIIEIRVNENGKVGIRRSNDISHLPESLREVQRE
jgi:broad specificity phosphatase PhoE